jgi:SAM-dependent methyltransferase
LHHLTDKKRFLYETFRVLRPNGRLYIMDPVMSPELRLAWSVMSRITERDYQGYVTEQELLDGIAAAGFDLRYFGQFLFPRSLKQLIDERLPLRTGADEGKDGSEFVSHVRRSVWEIVCQAMSEEMRLELHFDGHSSEGWFAYNCVELVACRQ